MIVSHSPDENRRARGWRDPAWLEGSGKRRRAGVRPGRETGSGRM